MGRDVTMTLLKTLVFANPMEIITTDDDGFPHLGGDNNATKQSAANGNISGEGTLLIDVSAVNGFAWGLDAESDVAEPSALLTANLADEGDGTLLREGFVVKDISHGDGGCGTSVVEIVGMKKLVGDDVKRKVCR